jgi:uncharacterized protein with HEPN domain
MLRDPRACLWDVREAADAIAGFVAGVDFETYAKSSLIHSAVERKFEIVGEALSNLRNAAPELAERIPEIGQIIAFRNLLIHGYAVVDHARVWRITQVSLPALRNAAAALLEELDRL